jgi:hypothetical protein
MSRSRIFHLYGDVPLHNVIFLWAKFHQNPQYLFNENSQSRDQNSLKNNCTGLDPFTICTSPKCDLFCSFIKTFLKGLGGVTILRQGNFQRKCFSPGAVTPWHIIDRAPLTKCTSQHGIFLCIKFHQNPPNDLGRVAKTRYFSTKMLSPGAVKPWKIIGQGSPYNMHIFTSWSFFVPSFTKVLQRQRNRRTTVVEHNTPTFTCGRMKTSSRWSHLTIFRLWFDW